MLKNMFANSSRRNEERARRTIRRVKSLMLPVALLAVVRTLVTCSATSGSTFQFWVASGLVRVGKTDAPGTTSSISLSGARGETVAALCASAPALQPSDAPVSAGQYHSFCIDTPVPHGAANSPPGTLPGTISITHRQNTATIPVVLTV